MSVRDRAGNVGTGELLLADGLASDPGPAQPESRIGSAPQVGADRLAQGAHALGR